MSSVTHPFGESIVSDNAREEDLLQLMGNEEWGTISKHPAIQPDRREDRLLLCSAIRDYRYLPRSTKEMEASNSVNERTRSNRSRSDVCAAPQASGPSELPHKSKARLYKTLRDVLDQASKREKDSQKWLERLTKDDKLFAAIASENDFYSIRGRLPAKEIRRLMKAEIQNKAHLLQLYEETMKRLGPERGAKPNRALSSLISTISCVVHMRTGNFLSQSNKDINLVWNVAEIADRPWGQLRKAAVENKMKEMIERNAWRYAPEQIPAEQYEWYCLWG